MSTESHHDIEMMQEDSVNADFERESIINYTLPQPVAEVVRGWEKYASSTSIVMALLATIHIVVIQILAERAGSHGRVWEALRWFAHSGLIINAMGSASAVLLVSMESTLTDRARNDIREGKKSLPTMMFREGIRRGHVEAQKDGWRDSHILVGFGFDSPRITLFIHFYLAFILGLLFFLITIALYIWCTESRALAYSLIPVLVMGTVPVFVRFYIHNLV